MLWLQVRRFPLARISIISKRSLIILFSIFFKLAKHPTNVTDKRQIGKPLPSDARGHLVELKRFDEPSEGGSITPEIMGKMENTVEILVADDEPAVALAIKAALKFCGYSVLTVPDGKAALQRVQAEPERFAVVLSDHNMPGVGGLALVQALRAIHYPGSIVIVSAFLTPENEASYRELGVAEILAKPFNIERLRLAIQRALYSTD